MRDAAALVSMRFARETGLAGPEPQPAAQPPAVELAESRDPDPAPLDDDDSAGGPERENRTSRSGTEERFTHDPG